MLTRNPIFRHSGPGVYHGLLAFSNQTVGDSVIDSANLLPYPAVALDAEIANRGNGDQHTVAEIPLSIGLTEFHFLLLYRDRVMGISSLDDRVVFEEVLPLVSLKISFPQGELKHVPVHVTT